MSRIHLFRGYYLGTGLITVVGTSFATLSTATAVRLLFYFYLSNSNSNLKSRDAADLRCNVQGRNVCFDDER